MVLPGDCQRISLRVDDQKRDRKSRYIRFPPKFGQWNDLIGQLQAVFLALLSCPLLGKVLSSYGSEPRRNVLFAQNWGQIFRRSMEVRIFVRIQKIIWDHLLASKKEASFSFTCGTPHGE